MFGDVRYPRQILLDRPQNDYQLHLAITKLTANETITPDRFDTGAALGDDSGRCRRRSRATAGRAGALRPGASKS